MVVMTVQQCEGLLGLSPESGSDDKFHVICVLQFIKKNKLIIGGPRLGWDGGLL